MTKTYTSSCLLLALVSSSALADVTPYHFTDIWYNWASPQKSTSIDMTLMKDPGETTHYYWSHFFTLANSVNDPNAVGYSNIGYTGMQTGGTAINGSQSPYDKSDVIFAFWGGVSSNSYSSSVGASECHHFDLPNGGDKGRGVTCVIHNYKLRQGDKLSFLVRQLDGNESEAAFRGHESLSQSSFRIWRATVYNSRTGKSDIIGDIFLPTEAGGITKSVLFSEYWLPLSSCSEIPAAKVMFSDLRGLEGIRPKLTGHYEKSPCSTNAIVNIDSDSVTIETSGNIGRKSPIVSADGLDINKQISQLLGTDTSKCRNE